MKTNLTKSFCPMILRAITLTAILLTLCLLPGTAHAQWNTNTSVNILIAGVPVADMQSAPTTDGKTWVAFYHQNGGNYDMRAQLIDANGYKLLGPDGVLVGNYTSGSATYVFNACVDASNNFIIGYQDMRSGSMQAVVYKISEAGTLLWGANGIVLGGGMVPYPAALDNGEVVFCWENDAAGTLTLQKITTGGTAAWATPVQVKVGTTNTTRGQIVPGYSGKFNLIYQKRVSGVYTLLYTQMFDNSGTAVYSPLQISNQSTAGYTYYSVAADGDTAYCGYSSPVGLRFNSWLQRINPAGTIPWGINGMNFNTSTNTNDSYQMDTKINISSGSNYVWSISNFCDPNQTNYGIYVQKFLKTTGARQFTDQAKMVYPITSDRDMRCGELNLVADAPMFMSYISNEKIYVTRLNSSGDFAWTGNRVELSSTTATAGNPKMRYCFTPDGPNRFAGVWTENRGAAYMGYAQGISIGGLIGLTVTTQGGVPAIINTGGGTLQMVATVYPATANQSVTWSIVPGTGAASISAGGLVTAQTNGTVYAKAVAVQDATMKDSLLITISNQAPLAPAVTTLPATNIAGTTVTLNGSVTANNASTTVTFNWGLTAAYGNTATASPSPLTGSTATPVLADLTGLLQATTYHFRCVGVNSVGTTYGADLTFTTCQTPLAPGTITGLSVVCQNQSGVAYSIPPITYATTYNWTVPAGATISTGAGTPSITVNYSAGAVSGNVTVAGANSCTTGPTATKAITVNPAPVPTITGSANVCAGSTNYTYTTETGMSNYTWTISSGGTIASGAGTSAVVVHWNTAGVQSISVNYSNANGCQAEYPASYTVTVSELPAATAAINGPSSVCAGAQGVFYSVDPVAGAVTYAWSLPAGADIVAGSGTNIITVNFAFNAVSGTISVAGNNSCGNGPGSTLGLTVNPAPATPSISANGYLLTSSALTGNQWYKDGAAISGATSQTYTVQATAWYWTVVTLSTCSSDTSNHLYILWVGIDEKNSSSVDIYPVPNNGRFNMAISSEKESTYKLDIYNNLGVKIYGDRSLTVKGNSITAIDMGKVPAGLYTVILRSENSQVTRKVLVNK